MDRVFKFYDFAAVPSLTSIICRPGILTSMSKFRVVYAGSSTDEVIQLEPDPHLPYQRVLMICKNTVLNCRVDFYHRTNWLT